jgi:hypothetical protein
MTERDIKNKYPEGTPHWRKDPIERYVCEKHGEPTMFIRDADVAAHMNTDTECY